MTPKIISLFSGAGGLDCGFEQGGFDTIWANEYDKTIWSSFAHNFPRSKLDRRSITEISPEDVPDADGIIGGPPCQSWSEAGSRRGIDDKRGRLFHDYIRILKAKRPKFFLVENVVGILQEKHKAAFSYFLHEFEQAGYALSWKLLNAHDYNVPETRLRVIIIGYQNNLGKQFIFPLPQSYKPTLKDAIADLPPPVPAREKNKANVMLEIANHEYMTGGFSTIYMSRNRVRAWNEPSFTIQASGRQCPIHPQAPKMQFVEQNKRIFVQGEEARYRRLSVRECARIQTFPDSFHFLYENIADGYKMVGNAVPVALAYALAKKIKMDLF